MLKELTEDYLKSTKNLAITIDYHSAIRLMLLSSAFRIPNVNMLNLIIEKYFEDYVKDME